MDQARLGAFIAGTRKELGMTQLELAEKLHVTDKAVSKWERGGGYPDVTLLEPLAAALGLGVEELMACRRQAESGEEEPMKTLLTISGESVRRERRRSRRLAGVLALVALAGAVIFYCATHVSEVRRNTIFLKETVDGEDFLYVELRNEGHLLKLRCGPGVDVEDVAADDTIYELDLRWNRLTYEGTVSACTPTGAVSLGGLEDVTFEAGEEQVFGIPNVFHAPENYYRNPFGEGYLCDYRFWLKTAEDGRYKTGMEHPLLLVEDCMSAAPWDVDGDGANEVVVRTRWPEKPYTIYDREDGEVTSSWPDTVPGEVQEYLVCEWEQ